MGVNSKYEIYLQSSEFARLRAEVFERDNYTCVTCGSEDNLQVHHLTYLHVYHEYLDELVCVCRKCHEIFHKLDNRRQYIEEKYRKDIEDERNKLYEQRRQEIQQELLNKQIEAEERKQAIVEIIKKECFELDYAKNGNVDMCNWNNLTPVIEAVAKKHGYDGWLPKQELRQWFFYRRCELFLRCIEKGITIPKMVEKTYFTKNYLEKWYKKDLLKAKLNEEKLMNKLKEEN